MKITKAIIQRYHEGSCNEAERKAVENWLQQAASEISFPEHVDVNALQEEVWQSFQEKQDKTPPITKRRILWPWIYRGAAASILLLLGITYILRTAVSPQSLYKTIAVPAGKKTILTLADGSRVYLNSGSTFQYPERFESAWRKVRLEGEAFFDIAKDTKHPFLIETPRSLTKVLGTRFNLRDFSNEKASSIVVEEGKVQYGGKGGADTLVLLAGNRGVWNTILLKKDQVHPSSYIDWKDRVLRFNDIPLAEAIPMIERWYGVEVEVQDTTVAKLHIKIRFQDAQLKKVLNDLTYLTNLNYKIHKNHVVLYR